MVFAGGGTLGHVIPAVPVVRALRARVPKPGIVFIGTQKGLEREFLEKCGLFDQIHYLDASGFKKNPLHNLLALWKFWKCYRACLKLLKSISPDAVVGMGGYVSAPVVLAAWKLKIKTAIHEQNAVYGIVNRYLRKKADRILLSFAIEQGEKVRLVGNPRTSEIHQRFKNRTTPGEKSLLVVGGSRGAERMNEITLSLKDEFKKRGIKVLLVTGRAYYRRELEKIRKIEDEDFLVKDFSSDLPELMFRSRAVASRAGATTLAEIMALKKPSLLIPSPNVAGNHQEKNALKIVERGGALMLRESELNKENFLAHVLRLLEDGKLRNSIIANLNWLAEVGACDKFLRELDEMMACG